MLLFTNWYTAGHGYPPGFLFPLWSISLEEQFYLAWPCIVKYLSPGSLLGVATFLMVTAYLALARLLHQGTMLDPGIWVNSLVQFQFFALGTITAIVLRTRVPRLSAAVRWALFVAGLLCMRGAQAAVYTKDTVLPHDLLHIGPRYLLALPGCLCLFFSCLQLPSGRLQRPFIYLGKISYGLYVFHVLWLSLIRDALQHLPGGRLSSLAFQMIVMAIALPATVLTGVLSYQYLESPFLRLKKRFTFVRSRPL